MEFEFKNEANTKDRTKLLFSADDQIFELNFVT